MLELSTDLIAPLLNAIEGASVISEEES